MDAIQNTRGLELQVVVSSGMLLERFGQAASVVKEDGFKISEEVYTSIEGENPLTMTQSVAVGLMQLAPVINRLNPDVVITIGDRYETIATAIAGAYMNKIVAHVQGGELTGTIDESVRHAITKLSHLHFTATQKSRERVIRMGENPKYVFNTGCPSIDLVRNSDLSRSRLVKTKLGGLGQVDLAKEYVVVMQHPVTTEFGSGFDQMRETLEAIKSLKMQTLMLWPNPDAGSDEISKAIRLFREDRPDFPVQFFKNIEPEDFAAILNNASCLIGNSSSFIREGSFLGTPAVEIGSRQTNREHAANVIYASYLAQDILKKVKAQIKHGRYKSSNIYGDGRAGEKIAEYIAGTNPPVQKTFYEA
ncbi:MAG: UDP-N,N'-diacetylbacillosamine 2-epimerase (hydrolyzing) [candidate division WS2 bacterium ADurb.Bin280]|uniref:UDP-N,N'-diacetylbacillosamine 2-epimerase (Hydrolyzing) n=1 Tax=candidate division WS2 bacterium ADurb.Bin280 TaxID=1852829 RepID=A0A1V5SC35_9BACT|nr:MAG: UDP-N,N'-diacetylbacillosamine 2-epimerase (hydrolyzing) [candidate division WS2 bacterium ADurb.Bin280]